MIKINATKVLCEDIADVETVSKAGILLPSAVIKPNTMKGKVLEIGQGTPDIKIAYSIGDTVIFTPHAGQKFQFEGKELRLLDVNEIILGGSL